MSIIVTNSSLKSIDYSLYYLYFEQMEMQSFFLILYDFNYSLDSIVTLFDILFNFTNYYFLISFERQISLYHLFI